MVRHSLRLRVAPDGSLEIVDPDLTTLPIINAIDPGFSIKQAPLNGFRHPRFLNTLSCLTDVDVKEVTSLPTKFLWTVHDVRLSHNHQHDSRSLPSYGASLLDIKIELARRELLSCRLCHHRCGVNRPNGETGKCGLGDRALVGEHFLHIAEEGAINPSYNVSLRGCALRCRYCQQYKLLPIQPKMGRELEPSFWRELSLDGARSLSFVGGNPDESLFAILRFLKHAPRGFRLPIVWNCHGYAEAVALRLLDGIVDVYVPDFKYGSESCAQNWSGIPGYVKIVRANIRRMVAQRAFVIVRILVLPGHFDCCHKPALRFLSKYRHTLQVNILSQYCPDYMIKASDGQMAARPSFQEIQAVTHEAERCGLKVIN